MKIHCPGTSGWTAAWCAVVATSALAWAGMVRAEEPACRCPLGAAKAAACPDAMPVLARIPYLNRLFTNVGIGVNSQHIKLAWNGSEWVTVSETCAAGKACAGETACGTEKACGADACPFARVESPVASGAACPCAAQTAAIAQCAASGCAACKCCACAAGGPPCDDPKCGVATMVVRRIAHEQVAAHPGTGELLQHIAELMAEKAAAETALEAREAAHAEISELFDSMAELLADNAALGAQLEASTEHAKLAKELADAATENARLKAQLEVAAERTEAMRSALTLALENERLKLRLAEVERQVGDTASRTATAGKPTRETSAR